MRDSLRSFINRIVVAPHHEIPNFYGKDVSLAQTIFEKGQKIFELERDSSKSFKAVQTELLEFAEQANLYGLTRQEYTIFNLMRHAGQRHPDLIVGPELVQAIAELDKSGRK